MPALPHHSTLLARLRQVLTRTWVAVVWLLVVLGCCGWIVYTLVGGRQFDTSILALLPDDQANQSPAAAMAKQQLAGYADERLVFLVSHADKRPSREAAANFVRALERGEVFNEIQGRLAPEASQAWRDFFLPYRYNLLTPEQRQQLPLTAEQGRHPLVTQALTRLYSPVGQAGGDLLQDPLQLFGDWLMQAPPKTPFTLDDGWLTRTVDGRTYRLISAELAGDAYNMSYQQAVMRTLQQAQDDLPQGATVLRSGLLIHAAHGAEQARDEVSTIGLGSLAGITLLLLYFFRRVRFLAVALLPIGVGWVFALAICLALFSKLHLITLAFGAGLVGVAIDYSLHYLCADREPRADNSHRFATLKRIFPGILLGLVSSVLAYAAQGAAPFPGLRQMAVFSACGLIGAWLTVVCWLPRIPLPRADSQARQLPAGFIRGLQALLQRWPTVRNRWVAGLLIVVALLSGWQLLGLNFDDSIRRLQTSPPSLLAEESELQRLTRSLSGSQYFVVSAPAPQALLETAELLTPHLHDLVEQGLLYDYRAISRLVPSKARQAANETLRAEHVYAAGGLAQQLAEALGAPQTADAMRAAYESQRGQRLELQAWLDSPVSELLRPLWLGEQAGAVHMVVALAGVRDTETLGQLHRLAEVAPGIEFIDNVASITQVLSYHREQLQRWLVVAYAFLLALLMWRYGRQAWRVVAAPALASMIALALLSLGGWVVNIFNLLALLLVLGIGLDASIFLRESARNTYTWVAVTLSAMTTLLAFGLLALSATPVLQQFGITVLLGITAVWLLAPCFVEKPATAEEFR